MTSVANSDDRDKKGDELKAQRFEMLADIAKELSGEVIFPTYFDAVLRLRKVLQDSSLSITEIAAAVSMEPLIGAKLLHLANSVAFNPAGLEVVDLKSALTRLGVNAVRTTAMSIVMSQLMRAKGRVSAKWIGTDGNRTAHSARPSSTIEGRTRSSLSTSE